MNKYIPILMIILFANTSFSQDKDYSESWKKVNALETEGLPKSALEKVEEIEKKAKADGNAPQTIKTLLFKSKYALTLEEDAQLGIITSIKAEIEKSSSPTKNILENVLANLYWQYFQQNRYKFYNRTKTEGKVDTEDFRTWDLQTLFNEVHIHFSGSLSNGLLLQQTKLEDYKALLINPKDSKIYRPTVFDFLSHNALTFYSTKEHQITKPSYKFEIDDSAFLSEAEDFSRLNITSKDSISQELNALKIYQALIKFHLKDEAPHALVDVNIHRLQYVSQNAIFDDKEAILTKMFKAESSKYESHEVSTLYDYEIANIYSTQAQDYNAKTKPENRWKLKDALDLCNAAISKFPKSRGAEKCIALKTNILNPNLQIKTESHLPIQTDARLLLTYKNLEQLDFKVYNLSEKQFEIFKKTYRKEEQQKIISKLDVEKQWQTTLKNENDYQNHNTEILLPKLDNGRYLIAAYTTDLDTNFSSHATIQITNIAAVEHEDNAHKHFQFIDRNNGTPIANTTVRVNYLYDNKQEEETKTTDALGRIKIAKTKRTRRNLKLKIVSKSDTGYFGDYYIYGHYRQDRDPKPYNSAFAFTDRSIYRPGQTVHFKAIAIRTKNGKSEVLTNEKITLKLMNTNYEEVKTLELVTNEHGSIAGEFILPNDGLTGNFNIHLSGRNLNANTSFSVEEYKRPKFETSFKPITETIRINDSVSVKGDALAYAGSKITDAKVTYRVKRSIKFPHWYYWSRPNPYFGEAQEITRGETTTDADGNYEVTFKAIPDQSTNKDNMPVFNYEITADVTDINGETRSATTMVRVGYHTLTANLEIDDKLDKTNKKHSLSIDTKNLNGEFAPAKGTIKIYKLLAPDHVLRTRPWAAPDYQNFSKEEFKKLFPHDAYAEEDQSKNWKKGKLVLNESFNTDKSKTLDLGNMKRWESGEYIIELETKDKFGQLVKDEARTFLYSEKDETLADKKLFSITTDKNEYKPNETVMVTLASAAKNIVVTVDVEKDRKIINSYTIELNNDKKTIAIPVTAEDLGGFAITYSFSAFNDFQSNSVNINVPYPKTDLEIETVTFRDKLQPGTDETWAFKIKGPKGDKVSAELLASMYDASLDQFKPHSWNFSPLHRPRYSSHFNRNARNSFSTVNFNIRRNNLNTHYPQQQQYDQWNWFGLHFGYMNTRIRMRGNNNIVVLEDNLEMEESPIAMKVAPAQMGNRYGNDEQWTPKNAGHADGDSKASYEEEGNNNEKSKEKQGFPNVIIRKNLQETAFFFPQLQTDKDGNVNFSFTTPEALTKWKLQLLAHTKTLESATTTLETVTQKELMVLPNAPRFLREGDNISISTKISNLSKKQLSGQAILQLFDAVSGKAIDTMLNNASNRKDFVVDAKGNAQVTWSLDVSSDVQAVQYKIIAKSGNYSDGEQNALPVLTNRMLVTETLPMWVRSNQTKTFTLDKLKTNASTTLKNHKLTLEMTSNPAWYAVQALPYLMEYPYDCNEQTFSRYYANALASHIANSNPRIQEVFNQWKNTDALLSNLEKNQELKSILIQETPWLRDAQSETEQKKRIALLFDLNKMKNELSSAKRKLESNQMSSGAWSWFSNRRANRYITQHIITGFGHLKQLKVETGDNAKMIEKAIRYLDAAFIQEYKDIRKYDKDVDLSLDHLSYTQLHYLYMRSFFNDIKTSNEVDEIIAYYHSQIKEYWLSRPLYAKGMMALVTHRMDDGKTASKILKSLKENAIVSEELGMYWKANTNSWFWYQAPIETQALLIEAFSEIENDTKTIDNLKIWLLKNKQTNRWKTTKATTDAVYALLLQGSDWLSVTDMVDVVIGGQKIEPSKLENVKVEAGTGYYKTAWNGTEIKPEMAEVKISKKGKGIAWGSLYWQYFEDLDKITAAETPLKLKKKLFLKTNTDKGEEISEITKGSELKVGDLVRVRIELRSDRAMEFVHMKDMRAAGMEPINVLSQYKYQDGLGYYESTKDASTNFFFDYLPKGVYVFEYDLRVNNAGNMSNGITTIQSMYAPEFSSHSEGIRVNIK